MGHKSMASQPASKGTDDAILGRGSPQDEGGEVAQAEAHAETDP